jgi:hypothetical protein
MRGALSPRGIPETNKVFAVAVSWSVMINSNNKVENGIDGFCASTPLRSVPRRMTNLNSPFVKRGSRMGTDGDFVVVVVFPSPLEGEGVSQSETR